VADRAPHAPFACSAGPHNPGFITTDRVIWREVRDADLTEDFDALTMAVRQPDRDGDGDAVGMITSRDLARFRLETACSGRISATCLATVGLTNAERVGTRLNVPGRPARHHQPRRHHRRRR
jgi:CBS domain-containing protein